MHLREGVNPAPAGTFADVGECTCGREGACTWGRGECCSSQPPLPHVHSLNYPRPPQVHSPTSASVPGGGGKPGPRKYTHQHSPGPT